jgi:sarcosine oxidase delta subunit
MKRIITILLILLFIGCDKWMEVERENVTGKFQRISGITEEPGQIRVYTNQNGDYQYVWWRLDASRGWIKVQNLNAEFYSNRMSK